MLVATIQRRGNAARLQADLLSYTHTAEFRLHSQHSPAYKESQQKELAITPAYKESKQNRERPYVFGGSTVNSPHRPLRLWSHLAPVPDLDIAQNHRTRSDKNPGSQLRVSVAAALPRPPQSNAVQEGAVIAHDSCLSEHHAGGVINHHPLSDDAARVDVHAENFRHPALDGEREWFPLFLPQHVSYAACLQAEVAPDKPQER